MTHKSLLKSTLGGFDDTDSNVRPRNLSTDDVLQLNYEKVNIAHRL